MRPNMFKTRWRQPVPEEFQVYDWVKVTTPERWSPSAPGDQIFGYYLGLSLQEGSYGKYQSVYVRSLDNKTFALSGKHLIQLIHAGQFVASDPIWVRFAGWQTLGHSGRNMRMFEVFKGLSQ